MGLISPSWHVFSFHHLQASDTFVLPLLATPLLRSVPGGQAQPDTGGRLIPWSSEAFLQQHQAAPARLFSCHLPLPGFLAGYPSPCTPWFDTVLAILLHGSHMVSWRRLCPEGLGNLPWAVGNAGGCFRSPHCSSNTLQGSPKLI